MARVAFLFSLAKRHVIEISIQLHWVQIFYEVEQNRIMILL